VNFYARPGNAVTLVAVMSTVLIGFAALAIDVGMLYDVRVELQRTADAAALAGASKLLSDDLLKGGSNVSDMLQAAQQAAQSIAALNPVQNASPQVIAADIRAGYFNNMNNLSEAINFNSPTQYNTVQVTVRRDGSANGPVPLIFGRIFGLNSANVTATAAAAYKGKVVGYQVTSQTGNAKLLPFALSADAWSGLLARTGGVTDNYTYDSDTHAVTSGPDGIFEVNLYPGSGVEQLPPGNFGTVNIGSSNNSTSHLSSQIRYGVTADDLSYYDGKLQLGADGTLMLTGSTIDFTGDPGFSAAIRDDLAAIIGQPRAIPLFREVTGPGNNSVFTIVGFAGIRIVSVNLTGSPNSRKVMIQPALVVDDSVITTTGSVPSYFVTAPVRLVR
jgi:Flp pilus assembly protein TadG